MNNNFKIENITADFSKMTEVEKQKFIQAIEEIVFYLESAACGICSRTIYEESPHCEISDCPHRNPQP